MKYLQSLTNHFEVKAQTITSSVPTEIAVSNIEMAVMDTPRIVNTGIRVQFVPQIN